MFTITLKLKWWLVGLSLAAVVGAGTLGALVSWLALPNVYVAGERYSGSDPDHVRAQLVARFNAPITLTWQGAAWQFLPEELGLTAGVDQALAEAVHVPLLPFWKRVPLWIAGRLEDVHILLPIHIDQEVLERTLKARVDVPDEDPVSARMRYGEPVGEVVPAVWGRRLDWEELTRRIKHAAVASGGDRSVELPVISLPPRVTTEDVKGWGELHTLGVATTTFDPAQAGRASNIRLAATRIDGVILLPGDEFSLNAATGERTLESGYKEAPVIIDGQLVPGVGGGVSQLASTTFNAALFAGMQLTEYHNHSLPVPYLPLGRDATVWYDSLDLRFVNTTSVPVVVNATAGYDWVRVEIRSPEKIDQHVIVDTQLVEEYPRPVEERIDPDLGPGERRMEQAGRVGQRIRIRQVIFQGGRVAHERQLEARYPPQPQVWAVGGGSDNAVPSS